MSGRGALTPQSPLANARETGSGRLFVQMHGEPGSGKSALARVIGSAVGAVVLDKDLLATGAIRAEGLPLARASAVAYETAWLLLPSLLSQGFSVVFDSPCYWPSIEQRGREIAAQHDAAYAMIECRCPAQLIDQRLAVRERLESHPTARAAWTSRTGVHEPTGERLVVDTSRTPEDLVGEVVEWVERAVAAQSAIRNRQSAMAAEMGGGA